MSLVQYGRAIKLSHSIFAMPFALGAALLASREASVTPVAVALIVVCMVSARSVAMGFNRIVDRDIDAVNPRTVDREIPAGRLSVGAAWLYVAGSALIFVGACAMLNPLVLSLSPVALGIVCLYSLTKRFTALCHVVLGISLGLAPTGAWLAIVGEYALTPALLSCAVATWVAGFDILYSCQDEDFDRSQGLRSVPVAMGVANAMWLSAALHVVTVACLAALPFITPLGLWYGVGCALIAGVLVYEHWIVRPGDLSRINKAFFDLNGYVSIVFLLFLGLDVFWG